MGRRFSASITGQGFSSIIDLYETLIIRTETSACEHNGQIRHGGDYQTCCGVSYEYLNDLSCRDMMEIIIRNVSPEKLDAFRERITALDERFRRIPKNDKWIIAEHAVEKYRKLDYWWYYGLPLTVRE